MNNTQTATYDTKAVAEMTGITANHLTWYVRNGYITSCSKRAEGKAKVNYRFAADEVSRFAAALPALRKRREETFTANRRHAQEVAATKRPQNQPGFFPSTKTTVSGETLDTILADVATTRVLVEQLHAALTGERERVVPVNGSGRVS